MSLLHTCASIHTLKPDIFDVLLSAEMCSPRCGCRPDFTTIMARMWTASIEGLGFSSYSSNMRLVSIVVFDWDCAGTCRQA